MKTVVFFFIFSSTIFGQTIETTYCYTSKSYIPKLRCYNITILQKDSAIFFSDTTTYDTKMSLANGPYKSFVNGKLWLSGIKKNGKFIEPYNTHDTNGTVIYLNVGRKKIYVDSTGKKYKTERETRLYWDGIGYELFDNYRAGIQPPTIFDWSIPSGFTVNGFNLHADIPMPRYYNENLRTQLVLSGEAGARGASVRLGLSPFNFDPELDLPISFTMLTINGSMTYLWEGYNYEKLDPVLSHRWYVGADLDFSYVLGHIRLGAYKLVGPEPNRDWQFMISLGLSPAIPVLLIGLMTMH